MPEKRYLAVIQKKHRNHSTLPKLLIWPIYYIDCGNLVTFASLYSGSFFL